MKKEVKIAYIRANVRIESGFHGRFSITIVLHQGQNLSTYLHTLVIEVLTEHIQETIPKCLFFCK